LINKAKCICDKQTLNLFKRCLNSRLLSGKLLLFTNPRGN
jgi:hypothetical protein